MPCAQAWNQLKAAVSEKTRLHDELSPLLAPYIGMREAINPHSSEFEHIADLQDKEVVAVKRSQAAWDAFLEASRLHRDD